MIEVMINGENTEVPAGTLFELLESRVNTADKYAVAINEQFIPKANYQSIQIQQGDRIELLMPMAGG